MREALEHLIRYLHCFLHGERATGLERISQGGTLEILHRDKVAAIYFAEVEHADDVRMAQLARCSRLPIESFDSLAAGLPGQVCGKIQLLDGNAPPHGRIDRLVDDIVRPRDLADDLVFVCYEVGGHDCFFLGGHTRFAGLSNPIFPP